MRKTFAIASHNFCSGYFFSTDSFKILHISKKRLLFNFLEHLEILVSTDESSQKILNYQISFECSYTLH